MEYSFPYSPYDEGYIVYFIISPKLQALSHLNKMMLLSSFYSLQRYFVVDIDYQLVGQ